MKTIYLLRLDWCYKGDTGSNVVGAYSTMELARENLKRQIDEEKRVGSFLFDFLGDDLRPETEEYDDFCLTKDTLYFEADFGEVMFNLYIDYLPIDKEPRIF